MNGWVKLHRKSLDHWLYNESRPHTRREAWEDILLLANHENTKVMIEGELIECKTGQSVMSLKSWAKQFKWTIQQVRTFFSLLQKDEMLHIEGLRKTTRVTVCNYVNYQYEQHTNNTEITRRQHGDNTETTTNKKGKKDKEVIKAFDLLTDGGWNNDLETYNGIISNYPKLFKMKRPLLFKEHERLVSKWGLAKIKDTYIAMEGWSDLLKKRDWAAGCAENWNTRDDKK